MTNVNLATDWRVPGRIKGRHAVYQEMGADPYITRLVEKGYRLEFDEIPPSSYTKNNKSALTRQTLCIKSCVTIACCVFQEMESRCRCQQDSQSLLYKEEDQVGGQHTRASHYPKG